VQTDRVTTQRRDATGPPDPGARAEGGLRADARRNRDRVVAAATQLFIDIGPDVPLDAVARAAGVGIGTLYRRFPDRDALVHAVVSDALDAVLVDVSRADDATGSAWDNLVRALGWSPSLRVILRLIDLPTAAGDILPSDPHVAQVRDGLIEQIEKLVDAAHREGTLRPDVTAGDVLLLMSAVSRALPAASDEAENAYVRAHALVLAGLRAADHPPLPGRPVLVSDLAF